MGLIVRIQCENTPDASDNAKNKKKTKKNEIRMYKRVTSYQLALTGQLLQGLKWKSGSWKRALASKGMGVNAKIKIMLSNEISRKASVVGKFSPSNSTLC